MPFFIFRSPRFESEVRSTVSFLLEAYKTETTVSVIILQAEERCQTKDRFGRGGESDCEFARDTCSENLEIRVRRRHRC